MCPVFRGKVKEREGGLDSILNNIELTFDGHKDEMVSVGISTIDDDNLSTYLLLLKNKLIKELFVKNMVEKDLQQNTQNAINTVKAIERAKLMLEKDTMLQKKPNS